MSLAPSPLEIEIIDVSASSTTATVPEFPANAPPPPYFASVPVSSASDWNFSLDFLSNHFMPAVLGNASVAVPSNDYNWPYGLPEAPEAVQTLPSDHIEVTEDFFRELEEALKVCIHFSCCLCC